MQLGAVAASRPVSERVRAAEGSARAPEADGTAPEDRPRGARGYAFRPPSAAHFSSMSVVTDFGRSMA